jgi:Predicted phosphotransferase related to Ser/Thr protein kinases
MSPTVDPRADQVRSWALQVLEFERVGEPAVFAPASSDASFRRYFRVQADGRSWIVMDAPPEHEDCRPFLRVAELMRQAGLHVPRCLAQDLERGFLLLDDLGRQTYLDVLDSENADRLYGDAIDALIRWQCASRPGVLPEYDEVLLRRELELFPDWYLARHLLLPLTAADRRLWESLCDLLVEAALAQPRVFVHRDYMPRNLMLSSPNPGVLDFQDAVHGPIAYDPLCLFKDAFLTWPQARVEGWLHRYWQRAGAAGLPVSDWPDFHRDCDLIGVQRHLKVAGIFARLMHRDRKPRYGDDIGRFIEYLREVSLRREELAPLRDLLRRYR